MRYPVCVAVVCLAGAVAAAGGGSRKDSTPAVFESPDGRFKAMLGDNPRVDARPVHSAAGPLEVHTLSTTAKDLTLSVTWTDYPESFKDVPPERLLAAVRDGMKTKDAKIVRDETVRPNDPNPAGREVQFNYGKYHVRSRLFLVGTRLYQVTATGKGDDVEGEVAKKFFASFEVLGR